MTATLKIYAPAARTKATEKDATLGGMDDEDVFGPVFHRLGFSDAPCCLFDDGYRGWFGDDLEKDDIFFFVHGLLHSPNYRLTYSADLKKMLPRIPQLAGVNSNGAADFVTFADAGRRLSELHLGYESVEPYPLRVSTSSTSGVGSASALTAVSLRVTKMRCAGKAGAWDRSTIRYNDEIMLSSIPPERTGSSSGRVALSSGSSSTTR